MLVLYDCVAKASTGGQTKSSLRPLVTEGAGMFDDKDFSVIAKGVT